MNKKMHLSVHIELSNLRTRRGKRAVGEERAVALAEAVIGQVLPSLALEAGVEQSRLASALLAELGYDVGRTHPPAAAMEVLAVATERLRDAITRRPGARAVLPAPTVRGTRTLQ
jgi:hypothetical protein